MSSPARLRPVTPRPALRVHYRQPAKRRNVIAGLLIALAVLGLGSVLVFLFWPFSQASVLQNLSEASDSTVTVQSFHATYFPPGCVLEGIQFRNHHENVTFLVLDKLVVEGSYLGILRKHVSRLTALGAKILIPPFSEKVTFNSQHSNIVVEEIIADGSVVEFESREPRSQPFRFEVHEARLTHAQWGSPIDYDLKFHNPNPPGEIAVHGKFGAWTTGHPDDTPISGDYTFEHADLSVYGGIAGMLSSKGHFEGVLGHINVSGTTDVPDFVVTSGGHKVKLDTEFDAYVDARHGDTFLRHVEAHFGRTTIVAEGSVARVAGKHGKTAQLHLTARPGRIEDVLGLFVTKRSPMSGETTMDADAEIPAGDEPFLRKLKLRGTFGVDNGNFQTPETQKDVEKLSAGARGENMEDPETVVTDLQGQVKAVSGVAHFSTLTFQVPGANARLEGTYGLVDHKINLHGRMRVDTRISKTTTGVKSLLLKVMDPIFRKKKVGEVVAVHVQGSYEKPDFGLDFTDHTGKNPRGR